MEMSIPRVARRALASLNNFAWIARTANALKYLNCSASVTSRLGWGSLALAFLLTTASAWAKPTVDYQRDVRPILSDHCFACHGPDAKQRKAELRLDQNDASLIERAIIVPGKPDESLVWQHITATDPEMLMPPPAFGKPLSAAQIESLRRWLEEGAVIESHWAFTKPKRYPLPTVQQVDWPRNEIDYFTLARMEAAGLRPSPEADRATLIRRVYLDLTGLPPTPARVAKFLADQDPLAYEHLVDEVLASRQFGERMAVSWLDQARFADTNGYSIDGGRHMAVWRDWVIDAYNRDMPFDQFTIEQLAGDLLPNATEDQRVASGFHRNHMITHEGGTIPEENLVNYVADRVKTTGEVFLGLTVGCAQCHDHKFDPLTQRDYYQLFAYFNTLSDRGLDGDGGVNSIPRIEARSVLARDPSQRIEVENELTSLRAQMQQTLPSQPAWENAAREELRHRGEQLMLHPVKVLKVTSPNRGGEYQVADDGTIVTLTGSDRSISISTQYDCDHVTAIRLVFTPHDSLPAKGIGLGNERGLLGSFLLTAFSASTTRVPSDQVDLYRQLPIQTATASASHPDFPPTDALDERDHNGWSPHPNNQTSQHITFQLASPVHASQDPYLTVMLVWGGGPYGGGAGLTGGQYRIYAVTGTDDGTNIPAEVQEALAIDVGSRTAEQSERVRAYHARVAPELAWVRAQITNLEERLHYLTEPQQVMVMDSAPEPRETFILNRGQYDQPTERVSPAVPVWLASPDPQQPANRLGLAQWLVRPDHPLTARVAVNRLWQIAFGAGLVTTSADFGSQGDPPSHPELLDWLAIDFVETGWHVKDQLRRMVLSATYRQRSFVAPEIAAIDPTNRWLARGARFRLPAEFIRDQALAVSGLLVDRLGGPSVLPYQPAVLWKEISHYGSTPATAQVFVQDHGEKLYRRSLYTYWKRTSPPPSLLTFDAPNREVCTVQRTATNTPLQALVLLNDPQYVEASRRLAERILTEGGDDVDARIRFAFQLVTCRLPSDREVDLVRKTYQREMARFTADPRAAAAYLSIGELPRNGRYDPIDHAAWAMVASLLLNLSETITRG